LDGASIMKLSKLKDIISRVAPSLGTALGGPLGTIAGTAIQQALGVDSEEAAAQILQQDPNAILELKKAEIEFNKFLVQADIDVLELEVQDRDSARELFRVNIWPQITLSGIFVGGYFWLLSEIMTGQYQPTPEMETVVNVLIGVLTAGVPQVMSFWLGSSLGSREKSARMS